MLAARGAPRRPDSPSSTATIDASTTLADWLTRNNRQFGRNLANRVWFHLLGRGIVEPVDDFRDSNPPSNPALLDALTDALRRQRHAAQAAGRLDHEVADLPARAPRPTRPTRDDEANFSHAAVRLLPAEVLLDAISQVAGGARARSGDAPGSLRAAQLPGPAGGVAFLKTFGKPDRLLTCECERSESTTLAQAFQMINGDDGPPQAGASDNRIGRLLAAGADDRAILDELYLAALCREPTAGRAQRVAATTSRQAHDRRKAWEDIVWALLNSKEFLLRH